MVTRKQAFQPSAIVQITEQNIVNACFFIPLHLD